MGNRSATATRGVCAGLFGLAFFSGNALAGGAVQSASKTCKPWSLESPRRSGGIKGFHAVDVRRLVAVGERGTIVRSTDRGKTWKQLASPVHSTLSAISGRGKQLYAVGSRGVVLRSLDGGATWKQPSKRLSEELGEVAVCGGHVIALGQRTLFRSASSGTSWTSNPLVAKTGTIRLRHLAVSGRSVVIVGSNGFGSTAWRSSDCGKTLRPIRITRPAETVVTLVADGAGNFYGFGGSRTVARTRMACGSCTDRIATELVAYRSRNRGRTWSRAVLRKTPMLQTFSLGGHHPPVKQGYGPRVTAAVIGKTVYAADGTTLFVSGNRGQSFTRRAIALPAMGPRGLWSAGASLWSFGVPMFGSRSMVRGAVSADGGKTWTPRVLTPIYKGLARGRLMTAAWSSPQGNMFVAGTKGTLLSHPRGQSWSRHTVNPPLGYIAAWGAGALRIAVGDDGVIARSTDRGRTFRAIKSGTKSNLYDIWARTHRELYVLGTSTLLRSTDAGLTWTSRKLPVKARFISLWGSGKTLYAAGVFPDVILRSTNSGASWTRITRRVGKNILGIWGASAKEIYAYGRKATLKRSLDGGSTWTPITVKGGGHASYWTGDIRDVWADGNELFVIIGGHLARSGDRGRTWAMVPSPFGFRTSRMHGTKGKLLLVGWYGDVARFDYRCKP